MSTYPSCIYIPIKACCSGQEGICIGAHSNYINTDNMTSSTITDCLQSVIDGSIFELRGFDYKDYDFDSYNRFSPSNITCETLKCEQRGLTCILEDTTPCACGSPCCQPIPKCIADEKIDVHSKFHTNERCERPCEEGYICSYLLDDQVCLPSRCDLLNCTEGTECVYIEGAGVAACFLTIDIEDEEPPLDPPKEIIEPINFKFNCSQCPEGFQCDSYGWGFMCVDWKSPYNGEPLICGNTKCSFNQYCNATVSECQFKRCEKDTCSHGLECVQYHPHHPRVCLTRNIVPYTDIPNTIIPYQFQQTHQSPSKNLQSSSSKTLFPKLSINRNVASPSTPSNSKLFENIPPPLTPLKPQIANTTTATIKKTSSSTTIKKSISPSIIAITENRSREVGYASYDQTTGEIEIGQFCDSQTYVHLYTKLYIIETDLVIIPATSNMESELLKMVSYRFPNIKIEILPRKLFNENNGSLLIKQYCLSDKLISLEKFSSVKYLAQACFSALIKYLEGHYDISFANNCLKIRYSGSQRTMQIDAETIKNLEIVHNLLDGSRRGTLFTAINHTKTKQGSRLLISNLVQPPIDIETIRLRQNSIYEILQHEKLYFSIIPLLSKIDDIDKILLSFIQTKEKKITMKKIENQIKNIISQLLSTNRLENPLLKMISKNLSNPVFNEIRTEILKYIIDKVPISKSLSLSTKIVNHIKNGVNGLLDVCKITYNETLKDINDLTQFYQEKYKLPQLKLNHSSNRGFYFSVPFKNKKLLHLPDIFIKLTYQNSKCSFVSEELTSLSRRNKEVFEEIILLTSLSLEKLIEFFRSRMSDLFNVGPLGIKQGIHPLHLKQSFIPNDTLINETSNFQIIHGPNMSGKSTYIHQVALHIILAHIGSFLPAEFATIPITEHLISRIGTSDSLQSNASTFMTEMKEISYILEMGKKNTFVIVDELGRGTSNIDGSSIAWAISEELAQNEFYTLFVTHYQELLDLSIFYPNIRNYYLMVSRENNSLKYSYTLNEGISQITRYGIDIAELAGIDQNVINIARTIRNQLDDEDDQNQKQQQRQHPARSAFNLIQKLLNLKFSKLSETRLREYLTQLKNDFTFNEDQQQNNNESIIYL
eukprot:gene10404-12777_t